MFNLKDYFNNLSNKERTRFANKTGIPLPTIQRHYIYKTRIPRPDRMRAMGDVIGIPAKDIAEFFLHPREA